VVVLSTCVQGPVYWHVDDLKVSHIDYVETISFIQWAKDSYGAIDEVKSVPVVRYMNT